MSTGLAKIDNFKLPATGGEASYDMDEYTGIEVSFPRVKIPAGGGTAFELPNPDDPDDPTVEKVLEGIIVYQHSANAYWTDQDAQTAAPDCSSDDGITGYGNPGGNCQGCPLNQFGSGEGGVGKACKNMRQIYILRDGDAIPLLLSLPPTSLRAFQAYANNLMFAGRALSGVKTNISLKKMDNGNNTYSIAAFRTAGILEPELAKETRAYAAGFREMVKADYANRHAVGAAIEIDPETGEIKDEDY